MEFKLDTSTEMIIGIATLPARFDVNNCRNFKKAFSQWLQYSTNIVFDCNGIIFIDSSGLGTIVSCLRKVLEQQGELKLSGLGPKASLIFELTKAIQLFSIYPDTSSAIKSFSSMVRHENQVL